MKKLYKVINKRTGKVVRYFEAEKKRDVPHHEINEQVKLYMTAKEYEQHIDNLANNE